MAKKPEASEKPELTPDEMKAALLRNQQERVALAGEEIQAACNRHKVQIVPRCTLENGSVTMTLTIQPTE